MNINSQLALRANIILCLEKINQGQSLSVLLDELFGVIQDNEKAFAHQLLLGTLRQWYALNRIGESLIKQPPSDIAIIGALNMGLYELLYMTTPDYALINETLKALKSLNKEYGVGLVNAILRKVADNKEKFLKKIQKNHSLPNFLAKQLKQDWGQYYDTLGQVLRQPAPIFLRVNCQYCTFDDYCALLTQANIAYQVVNLGVADGQAIELIDKIKITDLPKFNEGWVSVQDKHAQLSAYLLNQLPLGQARVLDACTAPGGKLAHVLEMFHVEQISLTALDNNEHRLKRVHENLRRLGFDNYLDDGHLTLLCADATTYQADTPFDVILLDAPCTATGVIRRHPDIGLLRQESDIAQTVQLQSDILNNLWQTLKQGGYLLYITCSLLKDENERQMVKFIHHHDNAKAVEFELTLPNQLKQEIGYQCLPLNEHDGDGFYYALLQKI